ncbi:hypothetical protein [Nakamurella leprariae]|uniref:Uncharacterized protein n=1 Tax=Nakamurella leprariae TaxID=2803911 RepID=A0A938Y9S9_9ACTN|nr:hypothetical protein [Nakamurella leprariae]MBM9466577.1 hypothetical protein [Nakamurella leprariae]
MLVASVGSDAVLLTASGWLGLALGWGMDGVFVAWIGFGIADGVIVGARRRTGRWRTAEV